MNCIVCDKVISDGVVFYSFVNEDTNSVVDCHEECHLCMTRKEIEKLAEESIEYLTKLTRKQMLKAHKEVFKARNVNIIGISGIKKDHLRTMLKSAIKFLIVVPVNNEDCNTEVQYIDMKIINTYLRDTIEAN